MSYKEWALTVNGKRHPFGEVEVVRWSIGGREYRTDDTDRPRADGRFFGRDYANPGDVEIELIIRASGKSRQERFDRAMELREKFTGAWNGEGIRKKVGAVAELEIAGRAIVTGRPRHVDWDDNVTTFGVIRGTALFVRDFDEAFVPGEGWQDITVGLIPAQSGGLIAPLSEPLTTSRTSTRARPFTVTGNAPAWPIITVQGPIQSGAKVELVNGWSLHLNRGLRYDEKAVFDTRPGQRTMKLNGKAVNLLKPSGARLSQMSLPLGVQEIALRGTSLEGTASVRVRWRNSRKVI